MALPALAHADEPFTTPLIMIVVGFDGGDAGNGSAATSSDAESDSNIGDAGGAEATGNADGTASDGAAAGNDNAEVASASKAVPYDADFDWAQTVFGGGDTLATYYLDMSGGAFTFSPAAEDCAYDGSTVLNTKDQVNDGIVHVTLHRPHGSWGTVNESTEVAQDFGRVVLEAFRAASEYVDFAQYDTNGDALLTPDELSVCVCVAGFDAAPFEEYDRTDIPVLWPHQGVLTKELGEEGTADGMYLASYIAIAEYLTYDQGVPETIAQEPLGVLYHELGHYLGLIDLYPQNDEPEKAAWGAWRIGELSLMDHGGWSVVFDGTGTNYDYEPSSFDPWSRYLLGWSTPKVVTESGDYTVTSQLSDTGYTQLLIPTADPDQYYLIENRQVEGHDAGLATTLSEGSQRGGIAIWHVDKGVYREYGAENRANDSDHAPALMPQFFEEADGRYTTDATTGTPILEEPFYDSVACDANLGDAMAAVELPLYASPKTDGPERRTKSGIHLQFPTESARDMTVHVELPTDVATVAHQAYPLDAEAQRALRMGGGPLGSLACNALIRETGADVAVVDAGSITGGLPSTNVTWADAYGVMPSDCNIVCYELTGAQLVELARASVKASQPYEAVTAAIDSIRGFCGLQASSANDSRLPDANAALVFGNMAFDAKAIAGIGAGSDIQASDAAVGSEPLDLEKTYRVAMTPGVVERYDFLAGLNPDKLLLWGSPADAVRSFVQQPDWEQFLQ